MVRADLSPVQALGAVPLSRELAAAMRTRAGHLFEIQVAAEFSDEQILTDPLPAEICDQVAAIAPAWLPGLGLRAVSDRRRWLMVATASVDRHEDAHGPTLLWTLFNDGLKLKIGRRAWAPATGDLILFDDRQTHEVYDTKGDASMLLLASIPLERL